MKTRLRPRIPTHLLALVVAGLLPLAARAERRITLTGHVLDAELRADLQGAQVMVMDTDSTILGAGVAERHYHEGQNSWTQAEFSIVASQSRQGDLLVKVTMVGFKPWWHTVPQAQIEKHKHAIALGDILMEPQVRTLGTARVNATKVKFYHHQDTMVYNADAFELPQGSALDALLSQLPGVAIDEDGHIYHHGHLVTELLLEGKDLLGEDGQMIREQLPAYLVTRVKAYHRQTKEARFVGNEHLASRVYVMDVKLHKEYHATWTGLLEGGAGWGRRGETQRIPRTGRLFAQRTTPHSRITTYAKDNNLNDTRKPGLHIEWDPDSIKEGVQTLRDVGLSYHVDDKDKHWEVDGSASFQHQDYRKRSFTHRTLYVEDAHMEQHEYVADRHRRLTFATSHSWLRTWQRFQLSLSPRAQVQDYSLDRHSIMEYQTPGGTNHLNFQSQNTGRTLELALVAQGVLKFADPRHSLTFGASVKANQDQGDDFECDSILYFFDKEDPLVINNYTRRRPHHTLALQGSTAWAWKPHPHLSTRLTYALKHTRSIDHTRVFALYQSSTNPLPLGTLPPEEEYLPGFDPINSAASQEHVLTHTLTPTISWKKEYTRGTWQAALSVPTHLQNEHLSYQRYRTDTTAHRHYPVPNIDNTFVSWTSPSHKTTHGLWYTMSTTTPSLLHMVDMYDGSDPMHIVVGNSQLKPSTLHIVRYAFASKRTVDVRADWEFRTTDDAIANGTQHDITTGAKIEKAYNIDGNWRTTAHVAVGFHLDRAKRFRLTTDTRYIHQEHTAIASVNATPAYNHTHTERLGQQMKLQYQYKGQSIALHGQMRWTNTFGYRKGNYFSERSIYDYQYGAAAVLSLPWQMQLATDIVMYCHRGYSDDLRNHHLVWNGRLSKSLLADRLTLMLDGYDILAQMATITHDDSASAHEEIIRDVLPRYILLHAAWKFNITPKRKDYSK